ncbi:MAG TPA: BBP7 family outer membrane beta-barrel protein [Pirellulales bacterium]|jgi:hypothetical protein|nr:BBP7 family outer membrane beta-barrel protein [Pirellulales bacterium]
MSINRMKLWLALGLQLLVTSTAAAQELQEDEWLPGIRDTKLFAPADLSYYGNGPRRNKGWFFTIEGLQWATSAPERTSIGNPDYHPLTYDGQGYAIQQNTMDTGFIIPYMRQGERLQLGFVDEDGKGWLVGTTVLHSATSHGYASNAGVSFYAPFVNGVNALEGFVQEPLVVPTNQPDGFIGGGQGGNIAIVNADINHNNVFGATGQDIGTPNATPPPDFVPPPDGFPDILAATDYGDLVQLPVIFPHLETKYTSRLWGIEVMRTWQLAKGKHGGAWDFMAGVRYLRFRDNFYFSGTGPSQTVTLVPVNGSSSSSNTTSPGTVMVGVLSDTAFTQTGDNNLVGPQIGLRNLIGKGRFSLATEARFMASANFQNIRQNGWVASRANMGRIIPTFPLIYQDNNVNYGTIVPQISTPNLSPQGVNHTHHSTQFSPVGELRLNAQYQIYRSLSVSVGWTGLVMGGMARSTNMVNYALPNLGILNTGNRQVVFVNGVTFGVNFNR